MSAIYNNTILDGIIDRNHLVVQMSSERSDFQLDVFFCFSREPSKKIRVD